MPKVNSNQASFSSGVLTPFMKGRSDTDKYSQGLDDSLNMVVKPHGCLTSRMGTKYVTEVKNSANKTRFIPFIFSTGDSLIIEVGNLYFRFIKNDSLIDDGFGSPYEKVSPYTTSQLDELYFRQSGDIVYIAHKDHPPKILSRTADDNWSLDNALHEDGPYLARDRSGKTMTITSVVNSATLSSTASDFVSGDIGKFVEYRRDGFDVIGEITQFLDANTVTIEPFYNIIDSSSLDSGAVIDYDTSPSRLRSSVTIWSRESENSYIKVGGVWYLTSTNQAGNEVITPGSGVSNYSADVMLVDSLPVVVSTTGVITVSDEVNTANIICSDSIFLAGVDEGRQIRLNLSNSQVWSTIDTVVDTKQVTVNLGTSVPVDKDNPAILKNGGETRNFQLGAWYKTNYPRVVEIHEQRLFYASTRVERRKIWSSKSLDFNSFAPTDYESIVGDASALAYSLSDDKFNEILWLQTGPVLLVGTSGQEWQIKPARIGDPLTPTNSSALLQTTNGSYSNSRPIKIGPSTLFINKSGRKLMRITYNFNIDSFDDDDLTLISEHVLRESGRGVRFAYQQEPYKTLWVQGENGDLLSLTYEDKQKVIAWNKHSIGGDGLVEDVVTIPDQEGYFESAYLIVKRTINGLTKRFIEKIESEYYPNSNSDFTGMAFLDSHVYESSSSTDITSVSVPHLANETVAVVIDGARVPDIDVVTGSVTLPFAGKEVYVGYPITQYLRILPLIGGSEFGSAQGKLKKVFRVDLSLLNSKQLKYGESLENLKSYVFKELPTELGQSDPLFTGNITIESFIGSYNTTGQFYIVQDDPYPLNVLAISPVFQTNE